MPKARIVRNTDPLTGRRALRLFDPGSKTRLVPYTRGKPYTIPPRIREQAAGLGIEIPEDLELVERSDGRGAIIGRWDGKKIVESNRLRAAKSDADGGRWIILVRR